MRFRNPAVERAFRESWLDAIWLVRAGWVVGGSSVYVFYSLLIYYASAFGLTELHWFRLFVSVPLLALVSGLLLARKLPLRRFDALFPLAASMVFANASYSYAVSEGNESLLYLYEMATIFVFALSYFPALFRPILFAGVVNTAISYVTFWHVWLSAGQTWIEITIQTSLLMGLALLGLFAAFSKDILIRTNFRAIRKSREEKAIAERLAIQANAASEAKTRFVAMVGHEFRTPLNAILGYSEVLRMQPGEGRSTDRMDEYLTDIHDSARRLHKLVENVLSISSGPDQPLAIDPETVDLSAVVLKALKLSDAAARDAELVIGMGLDSERRSVQADSWMLAHMINELLSNAIKFTGAGGNVAVNVVTRSQGVVAVEVADTGIGMSDAQRKRALEPFFQSDDTLSRSHDGLGLGLTLVTRMMAAHGGDIEIVSQPGAGTKVSLLFPVLPATSVVSAA